MRRDRKELLFANQADIIAAYEAGFPGAYRDTDATARLAEHIEDEGGYAEGGAACAAASLVGDGAGKLSLPYMAALQLYPGVLPGVKQERGDCVTFNSRTASLVSYCASLVYGENSSHDDAPPASPIAIHNGLFSTESWYWYRGYDGDGWSCAAAAEVGMKFGGLVLRQNYPDLGINLEEYSPGMAGKWGRTPPPGEVRAVTSQHLLKNATVCNTWEQVRDLLANGYGISTCGGESWSFTRDDNGVCRRTPQGWAHAIAAIGADDRDITRKKYGCGLLLLQNSWGEYLSGSRKILGSDLMIPPGSFWALWDDCSSRTCIALSTGKGWKANLLPDWGLGGIV